MENRGKNNILTFVAVGDIMPNRDKPETIFELSAPVLRKNDVRFGQLETNFTEKGTPNSAARSPKSGRAYPRNVKALTLIGQG